MSKSLKGPYSNSRRITQMLSYSFQIETMREYNKKKKKKNREGELKERERLSQCVGLEKNTWMMTVSV